MNHIDTMKLALEALKEMLAEFRALDLPYGSKAYAQGNEAAHALRLAIEQADCGCADQIDCDGRCCVRAEKQEPVAWCDIHQHYKRCEHNTPPQRQPDTEPVGVMMVRVQPDGTKMCKPEFYEGKTPPPHALLYTAPPQRQPLTEDETMTLMHGTCGAYWADEAHIQRFRCAIERAHGIGGDK